MRQQLIAKQQELLRLQQERLELELAETKAKLEKQKKEALTSRVIKLFCLEKQQLLKIM